MMHGTMKLKYYHVLIDNFYQHFGRSHSIFRVV